MIFGERITGSPPDTSARTDASAARSAWVIFAVQIVVVACAVIALTPTVEALKLSWTDTHNLSYTHGYLIAAVCLWLLFRNRHDSAQLPIRQAPALGLLLVLASLLWLILVRASIEIGHQLLLPGMILLAAATALGPRIAARNLFAYGYLYFAIPIWDFVNGLLQAGTVYAVAVMLKVTAVSAYVDGNFVHLASGVFEIAGGCSGLHFFIVALALGALYGELQRDTLKVRVQLVAMAFVLALIANWLRVYSIIVAGYMTDMQHYLVRVEHYRYGWLVFAVMMVIFILLARRLPSPPQDANELRMPAATPPIGVLAMGVVVAIATLVVGPLWNQFRPLTPASITAADSLPRDLGSWAGPVAASSSWKPIFEGAERVEQGEYYAGDRRVEALNVIYSIQTQDRELTGYRNSVAGSGAVSVVSSGVVGRMQHAVNELVLEVRGERSVLWYFYAVDGRRTEHGALAQLLYGAYSLAHAPSSRLIAGRTPCADTCDAARQTLHAFFNALETRAPGAP